MARSRVYGILAGYEDQNDHGTLRADPTFKLLADRSPADDDDLASQPTLIGERAHPSRPCRRRRGKRPAAAGEVNFRQVVELGPHAGYSW
jgi:hypothetical protein